MHEHIDAVVLPLQTDCDLILGTLDHIELVSLNGVNCHDAIASYLEVAVHSRLEGYYVLPVIKSECIIDFKGT